MRTGDTRKRTGLMPITCRASTSWLMLMVASRAAIAEPERPAIRMPMIIGLNSRTIGKGDAEIGIVLGAEDAEAVEALDGQHQADGGGQQGRRSAMACDAELHHRGERGADTHRLL